ncbi:MAG: glycine--tRNA ligase subunit beta [Polycyclovorans sp.]|nr:glycine--tRNA ligase subunit beta [Polycyclovorans sp.]|tara:strand:- start:15220 stop:17307 length:2088 start_codon:yes stop_codon:yes gene_type:complete
MSRTLLIEVGTEDLPARYVLPLADALRDGITQGLSSRGLAMGEVLRYATPRRLAVLVTAVPEQQPDQQIVRSGPALKAAVKDGQPTPAGLGFAKSCGVDFGALGERDGKLHFEKRAPGAATADLLQAIFTDTLKQMDQLVPKRMRWGSGEATFVRPVTWLAALFGTDVPPLQAFGLTADRITYGHRFHAPLAITLDSPESYAERLFKAKVIADPEARKTHIAAQINAEAQALGGHARVTEDLLDEVAALVEWPVAITGYFEARFLELPPEVIVATVETNQRYFTVFEDAGQTRLTSAFITVINIESRDVTQVVAGNERVVRPRLSDAAFFFDQDRAIALDVHAQGLARITFQQALGTVADKQARIATLAAALARDTGASDQRVADVQRAAALCKADLVTKMVFEFPELQGLMGGDYARRSGAPESVWRAIREHYLPTQQGTPIPSTAEGQMVALADKLDSLAGIFAIGQKPTASKDPYALRRAALGVLRILIEGDWSLDLGQALQLALDAQPAGDRSPKTRAELLDFILERLRAYRVGATVDGRAITPEAFEAVRTLGGTRPLDLEHRLQAVHQFVVLPAAPHLAAANKRIRNVLRQAAERDGHAPDGKVDPQRLTHTSEQALWTTVEALEQRKGDTDYAERLLDLANLRDPVDDFFEAVMVNDDDAAIRQNRLALLTRVDTLCREVADISQLPG